MISFKIIYFLAFDLIWFLIFLRSELEIGGLSGSIKMTSSFSTHSSLSSLRGTKDIRSTLGVDASSVWGV